MADGLSIGLAVAENGEFFDVSIPHRLAGQTLLDGQAVRRRVDVRSRRSGAYIISGISREDGTFEFRHLPAQSLSDPYVVICFDDNVDEQGNALVMDRVYQVNVDGNPPQV